MKKCIYFIALIIIISACKTAYQPPATQANNNYLVVEGIINNSPTDSTFIKLSRTVNIASKYITNPELRAVISIEDGQGYNYILKDMGKGNYAAGPLGLNTTKQYRLRIKTFDNRVYLSDLVAIKYTPPIDSVGYHADNDLKIYVNTHDDSGNTRYYQWDFIETWEYSSWYKSNLYSTGTKIIPRPDNQQVFFCWQNATPTSIILSNSAQLTKDVIYQAPVTEIGPTDDKIRREYSILVRQHALTLEAYKFWEQTKKNTEQLGSIFDALPSQINGNIHCITNPQEPVFGYISIANIQSKRIFIYRAALPQNWDISFPYTCPIPDTVTKTEAPALLLSVSSDKVILDSLVGKYLDLNTLTIKFGLTGYTVSTPTCADCRVRGTNNKPAFWK